MCSPIIIYSFTCHGATLNNSSIPGMASIVHNQKKLVQPKLSTMKPVDALIKVRGIEAKLVNNANCVAV